VARSHNVAKTGAKVHTWQELSCLIFSVIQAKISNRWSKINQFSLLLTNLFLLKTIAVIIQSIYQSARAKRLKR